MIISCQALAGRFLRTNCQKIIAALFQRLSGLDRFVLLCLSSETRQYTSSVNTPSLISHKTTSSKNGATTHNPAFHRTRKDDAPVKASQGFYESMKWLLTVSGILVLVAGLIVGFLGHVGVMFAAFFGFVGLLVTANLDRISEFKASGSGIEARTREVIARAESTLSELQMLARNVGELTLSLVKRSGRIGGYDDNEQERIKTSVLEVLKKVGVPNSEFSNILSEWDRFIELDYAHAILGGHIIPEGADNAVLVEWKTLREGGIGRVPGPDEIRAFLTKHSFMTEELDGYLKDYEHFRAHKVHLRPNVWRERKHWGRLKKP